MEEMIFKGRIAISGNELKGTGFAQYKIGGALVAHKDMPVVESGGWEMIEAEIIIRPTKIHRKVRETYKNARLDHVAQLVGKDDHWSNTEEF